LIWVYRKKRDDDVISFRENQMQVTVADFIAKGNFLWNSGMFCFKAAVFRRIKIVCTTSI
jgi:mannose-1-phosphate guanylyltransferase